MLCGVIRTNQCPRSCRQCDRRMLSIRVPVARNNIYEIDVGALGSTDGTELQNNFAFYTLNELAQ